MEWSAASGDATTLGRLIVNLEHIYATIGHTEARSWLERAAGSGRLPDEVAAAVDLALGQLAIPRADAIEAQLRAAQSLKFFTASDDLRGIADAKRVLAGAARHAGDRPECDRLLAESLAAAEEAQDKMRISAALGNLAVLAYTDGDWTVILERGQAALEAADAAGDNVGRAKAMGLLGEARCATGDIPSGREILERALYLLGVHGGGRPAMDINFGLAHAWAADIPDRAEAYLRRSAQLVRDLQCWSRLGDLYIGLAEIRAAQRHHGEALTLAAAAEEAVGDRPWLVDALDRRIGERVRAEAEEALGQEVTERRRSLVRQLAPEDILTLLGAPIAGAGPEAARLAAVVAEADPAA